MRERTKVRSAGPGVEADGDFRTLPEKLAADLREKILLGEFAPGAPVHERETAAAMGVSRTPLREALRILANEGLMEVRAARSPVVSNPTAEDVRQLYSVMRVLEALAGEMACLNAREDQLVEVRTAHEALRDVDPETDTLAFFKGDQAFHGRIVAAAACVPLAKTHGEYNARLWRARFLTAKVHGDRDRILHDHEQIVLALEARDTGWATQAMSVHLRSAEHRIGEVLAG